MNGARHDLIELLFAAQEGCCYHCQLPMQAAPWSLVMQSGWTKEHIIPKARGGRGLGNNFVLAHKTCNAHRGSPPPSEADILRTMALYARAGLRAFTMVGSRPIAALIRHCRALFYSGSLAEAEESERPCAIFAARRHARFFAEGET